MVLTPLREPKATPALTLVFKTQILHQNLLINQPAPALSGREDLDKYVLITDKES